MQLDYINNTVNCCGDIPISIIDTYTSETLFYAKDIIYELSKKSVADLLFNNEDISNTDLMIDLEHLLMYLITIAEKRLVNEYNSLIYAPKDYYSDYNLKEITKYFLCKGINIDPILDIWNLNNEELASVTIGSIGTMGIEDTTTPFEIL